MALGELRRNIGKIALRTGLIGVAAVAVTACATDQRANTPTLTLETRTPISGKVLTPESTGEVRTDVEFVEGLLTEYLNLDADPQLKKLKDSKYLSTVLKKEVSSGNLSSGVDYKYIFYSADELLIWVREEQVTISFLMNKDGHVVDGAGFSGMSNCPDTDMLKREALSASEKLKKLLKHEPKDWKDSETWSSGIESNSILLPDAKMVNYTVRVVSLSPMPTSDVSIDIVDQSNAISSISAPSSSCRG